MYVIISVLRQPFPIWYTDSRDQSSLKLGTGFFLYLIVNHAVSLQQYFFVLIVWVEVRVLWQQLILHVGCPALSEPWEKICFLQPVNRIVAAVFKILYVTMHLHRYKGRLLDWPKTGILPTIPVHFQWYKKRENRRSTSKTWWGLGDWAWFIAGGGSGVRGFWCSDDKIYLIHPLRLCSIPMIPHPGRW